MSLSKSSFKKFKQCKEYFWFSINRPEVLQTPEPSDFEQMLAEQGKYVEKMYYSLIPELKIIGVKGNEAISETNNLIQQSASHIAQAAFEAEGFFAQADLVQFKGRRAEKAEGQKGEMHIDLYEIKSSSSMQNMGAEDNTQAPSKEEHITDLAFQYEVASLAGYTVDTARLVELNKQYAREGALDLHSLFSITDVTKDVIEQLPLIREQMRSAMSHAASTEQPVTCACRYKPRKKQCPAFDFMHPELRGYNVYELPYPGKSAIRLKAFVDAGIFRFEDIPSDWKLLDSHRFYISTWLNNQEIIETAAIRQILDELSYPLYFLDYETTGPAIPKFDHTRPYQQIPFQYSLHFIEHKNGEIRHAEYLHGDPTPPMPAIAHQLRNDIGDTGTIIVWNKTFEKKCNENLTEAVPSMREFLHHVNSRIFDLMEIFSKNLYVHKDFRGSASIKKVLPVLVPDLSYKDLVINDGGKATTEWSRMVSDITDEAEKETLRKQLLEYCKLDTLAMVEIWKVLKLATLIT